MQLVYIRGTAILIGTEVDVNC